MNTLENLNYREKVKLLKTLGVEIESEVTLKFKCRTGIETILLMFESIEIKDLSDIEEEFVDYCNSIFSPSIKTKVVDLKEYGIEKALLIDSNVDDGATWNPMHLLIYNDGDGTRVKLITEEYFEVERHFYPIEN